MQFVADASNSSSWIAAYAVTVTATFCPSPFGRIAGSTHLRARRARMRAPWFGARARARARRT
jgi:hypothetical protein